MRGRKRKEPGQRPCGALFPAVVGLPTAKAAYLEVKCQPWKMAVGTGWLAVLHVK